MAFGQIILSEIMFDPSGIDAHDEFIEVFNLSDKPVDLAGWLISDGVAEDVIIPVEQGTILLPGQYGLVLDSSYFANSESYDSLIPDSCIVMTIDNSTFGSSGFSNSVPEEISLKTPDGTSAAKYVYSIDNPPGTSDEKILLTQDDRATNWGNSIEVRGSPGAPNTNRKRNFDLRIDSMSLQLVPPQPQLGDEVTIFLTIHNSGVQDLPAISLTLFTETEPGLHEVATLEAGGIASGDSTRIGIQYRPLIAGLHTVLVTVHSTNNVEGLDELRLEVPAGVGKRDILITEIMYSVLDDQSEWVEILNLSAQTINLKGWSLSDSRALSDILASSYYLHPGDFALLSESDIPLTESIVLSAWPALNNGADRIALRDAIGNEIDAVPYESAWGGDNGISLERVSNYSPSDDSGNWTSAVAPDGATPGAVNSVFTEVIPTSLTIDVSPNPFSPDGDGHDDFALVSYNVPATTADIRIQVYDLRGRLIRELINSAPSGAQGGVVWDGKDRNGVSARIGVYIVFIEAQNAREGVLVTARKTVVVAAHL